MRSPRTPSSPSASWLTSARGQLPGFRRGSPPSTRPRPRRGEPQAGFSAAICARGRGVGARSRRESAASGLASPSSRSAGQTPESTLVPSRGNLACGACVTARSSRSKPQRALSRPTRRRRSSAAGSGRRRTVLAQSRPRLWTSPDGSANYPNLCIVFGAVLPEKRSIGLTVVDIDQAFECPQTDSLEAAWNLVAQEFQAVGQTDLARLQRWPGAAARRGVSHVFVRRRDLGTCTR